MEALSYCQLMERCLAAEARVAKLESRTVTVKLPDYRATYKEPFAIEIEHHVRKALNDVASAAGIQVIEGCDKGDVVYLYTNAPAALPVTVNLAEDKPAESESEVDDAEAWFDEGWNARGEADRAALVAAGIRVIEGEG